MLKSKAVSLAQKGERVTYIFLGGKRDMEAVMTVATRLQMSQYPTITVLSLAELVTYHRSHITQWFRAQVGPIIGFLNFQMAPS